MTPARSVLRPSPVWLAALPVESAGTFAARVHATATLRGREVRGRFGRVTFVARPGDALSDVLAPFYSQHRW